ncbi:anti-sigma factor family protein [Catenulispora subtropica]|uniref:Zf-HC2 domain-containing protein n=1 Tax=Catenulispora subtropica TaxID=450798 RepID=A0ABN2SS72_9ACTN
MGCDEFVESVTVFLEGALPPADEARFVAHLTECDGCETYVEQFRRTVGTLGSLGAPGEPSDAVLSGEARATLIEAFRTTPRSDRL